MRFNFTSSALALLFLFQLSAGPAGAADTLKSAFAKDFLIGMAVTDDQVSGRATRDEAIITQECNAITPENLLKWAAIHPQPDQYDFAAADRYVAFGTEHHMQIVGHVLVWHNQTPDWVFNDSAGKPVSRDVLLARMKAHIFTVMGRYKGRIQRWDVVNEAFNDDGSYRASPWYKIIGPDYLEQAFRFAHEADPNARLAYNDYNMVVPAKQAAVIGMIQKLKADGVRIDTVGMQGHYDLKWPDIPLLEKAITAYGAAGVQVAISELDLDVLPPALKTQTADVTEHVTMDNSARLDPYKNGLPEEMQKKLSDRYAGIFALAVKHRDIVSRITLWGVTDGQSWRNYWPINGRTSYPLLFNRAGQPKEAYFAVLKTARP